MAGTALQARVRNPLAEPCLLGVSSGSSLATVTVIVFGVGVLGQVPSPVAAFAGALLRVCATARTGGRIISVRPVPSGWRSPRCSPGC
nr:iron chelate uptake ABC transporter family permease subunit [Streptomyces hirsutus]